MLAFKNRLAKKRDIERVQRYGQAYFSGSVVLKILKNDLRQMRIGFVVGTRVSKKATERNRIKRQLREFFRPAMTTSRKYLDILVLVKQQKEEKVKKEKLIQDVQNTLEKAKLLTKNSN
ncbi:MAG: ribonuclease P protein component [Patescibacteria group bacterium]